jgi:hypothetical protein
MINWAIKKIAKYFSEKAVAKINADPIGVVKQHFSPMIEMLSMYGQTKILYWVGAYEYDLELPAYFKSQEIINNKTFDKLPFQRSTEDEKIIDIMLGKGDGENWFLAFFVDSLYDFKKGFLLLDTFNVVVSPESGLNTRDFKKII